ncbi:chemokine XC receptor 1 [Nycticebus coucang]|uniref:chemokine XC receptor 1 n=1 Tax=Nycticebus coucang TaxID=9470 RepID=UPI00234D4020|nr:chemokine XC receptor 1 [Nycticebus coucang]
MESSGTPATTTPFHYDLQSVLCENTTFLFATLSTTMLYCLVFLLSLMGNSLVLWVLLKYESLESLTNVFILNLCLSDLAFSSLLPVWIAGYWGWAPGDFPCQLLSMVFSTSLYSSIFFLTVMTVHRYLSVVSPLSTLRVPTLRCRALATASVWLASTLFSVLDAVSHRVRPWGCDYSERTWFLASVYQHNAFFLLSVGVIVFCYVQILRTLFRSRSKRRLRTVRLIFTIVAAYFLSWAPYNLLLFLQTLQRVGVIRSCRAVLQLEYAVHVCRNLAFSHCCFNPVLYVFVGVKFRTHLKHLLRQFCLPRPQAPSPPLFPPSPGASACEGASFY